MKIRKQVYELTLDDFESFSVWEFALNEEGEEGQDEATVRPFKFEKVLDPSEGMFVIRADFTLADGTRMIGFLTPPVDEDKSLGTLQPIIITNQGQIGFWHGLMAPGPAVLHAHYQRLERDKTETFPVHFSSTVDLLGGPIEGDIGGFLYIKEFKGSVFEVK